MTSMLQKKKKKKKKKKKENEMQERKKIVLISRRNKVTKFGKQGRCFHRPRFLFQLWTNKQKHEHNPQRDALLKEIGSYKF